MATPAAAPAKPAGFLSNTVSAAVSGVADSLHALNQTANTFLADNPYSADTALAPDYEQNYKLSDVLHPLDEFIPKAVYQISKGAPVLAAGILGGIAGESKGGTPGAIIGGSLAAGTMQAVQTLGPAYAAALKANPKDPDAAFDSALKTAGESGVFSAAGWALFSWTPFKDAARDILAKTAGIPETLSTANTDLALHLLGTAPGGAAKDVAVQALAVQPAVGAVQQVADNVQAGKPLTTDLGDNYLQSAVGTAIPLVGMHAIGAAVGSSPKELADRVSQTIDHFKFDTSNPPDVDMGRDNYQPIADDQHAANQAALNQVAATLPGYALKNADGSMPVDPDTGAPVPGDTPHVGDLPLQAVKPQDLPTESDGTNALTRDQYEAASAINAALGIKNTIVFHDDGSMPADGLAAQNTVPDTVFISDHTSYDPMAVSQHEVAHLMPAELKAATLQVISEGLTPEGEAAARARHDTDPANPMSREALLDEVHSDIQGDAQIDPTFQAKVLDALAARVGPAEAKSYAQQFLQSITDLYNKVKNVVTGKTFTTPDGQRIASAYVNNLEAVHTALAAAVADKFVTEGYHPPGGDKNASQVLVQRALDYNAAKRAKRANDNLPPHQRTILKGAPPEVPVDASPDLQTAVGAALKDPFDRTVNERLALNGVLAGTRMSPKDDAVAREKEKLGIYPKYKQPLSDAYQADVNSDPAKRDWFSQMYKINDYWQKERAGQLKMSPKAPDTPEFRQFIGNSKEKDVWYHGTARDISEFKPKQAGAIFLTKDPEFAEGFSHTSESYMQDHAHEFLSDEERQSIGAEAQRIASRDGTNPTDELNALSADRLPSRANTMPVYVRTEKPFDYEDPKQVAKLIEFAKARNVPLNADDIAGLRAGAWNVIEHPAIQQLLKESGHDGFYAAEAGRKNLAVYDPAQIKSAIGNTGAFSLENPDIRMSPKSEAQKIEAARDMRNGVHVNIGLNIGDKVNAVSHEAAEAALKLAGVKILKKTYLPAGKSEPTLVATLDRALTPAQADAVSRELGQEAIAQYNKGKGTSYGPKAGDWEFNPDYFQNHGGTTLSDVNSARIAEAFKDATRDPQTGVYLTPAMRDATSAEYKYGDKLPFTVTTQPELGELMQEMSNTHALPRVDDTPENREFSARVLEHEARLALEHGGSRDAMGWYSHLISATRRVAALIHPELAHDDNAWAAFTYALAVTSNGHTIAQNVANAFKVYAKYNEKTHTLPVMGFGVVQENMKDAFRKWNDGVASVGVDAFRQFLTSKQSVRTIKEINPNAKELVGDHVYGGTIIGSKIGGGFFANMNGKFDALTMDRWFMRTWGRVIGHLVEETNIRTQVNMGAGKPVYTAHRGTALIDDPRNGSHRHYIRASMDMVLDRMKADYPDLTMAELQAILWYEEKDLYAMHGVNSEEPTDYAIESSNYAKQQGIKSEAVDAAHAGTERGQPAGGDSGDNQLGEAGSTPAGDGTSPDSPGNRAGDGGQEPGGRSAQLSPKGESDADYGRARDGAISVTGVHYSTQPRAVLDSKFYGRGMKGEEAGRLAGDLRNRTYFYVNEGNGTHPESGVGDQAHSVNLRNMYDAGADPLGLDVKANGDANAFEKSVHDAGFDGYYIPKAFGRQGAAVLLGDHALQPQYHGTGYDAREMTPQEQGKPNAYRQSQAELAARTDLPAGEMPGDMWQKRLPEADLSHLDPNRMYYKDEIVKRPDVSLSPKAKPEWVDKMDPKTQEFLRKAGAWAPTTSLQEKIDAARDQAGLKTLQATLDQFASVKQKIGEGAYKLLRMSSASDAALDAAIEFGQLKLNSAGALETVKGTKSFLDIMRPLKGEAERFFAWMAANRALQLSKEQRENLFGDADINAGLKLNKVMHAGDEFKGGDRTAVYAQALKEYTGFNKSILDIATKSGLINAETRAIWEKQFYVPFFRNQEESGKTYNGNVSGMVNQYASKRLTGGTGVLKDLLANTLENWGHLLEASLKNNAARETLEQGEKLGIATKVADVRQDLKESRHVPEEFQEKNAVFVMKDGKKVQYTVQDPLVLASLSALDATPFQGPVFKALGWFKHILTVGTTISPVFRIRHTIREQITALAANPTTYNFVKNWVDGFKYSSRDNPEYGRSLSGGAYFRMGMTLEDQDASYVKRLIAESIDPDSLVTDPNMLKLKMKQGWAWWKETGERSDSITRANLYRQTYAKEMAAHGDADKAHFEASYVARDAMDYGLRGTSSTLRMITQVVPFMNARLQGLYKLGRGAAADPRRFAAVIGGVTLATVGLSLAYRNDPDWKKRSEWDRNNNWWAKIGDKAIRMPKPFEVGALATVVDRALETAMNGFDPESRERFASQLGKLVFSQLSLNPIPQAIFPALETWANKDEFTGRQIETMRDNKLSPSQRIGPNTSATAQLLGKANVLSPEQIDFLVNAYFGWIGAHAVATADLALRPAMGLERPARRIDDYFLIGDFVKDMPSNQSRFVEQFYDHLQKTQQAFGDMRNFAQTGRGPEAAEAMKNPDAQMAPMYLSDSRTISQINKSIRLLQYRQMDPDAKRAQLDQLEQVRNRIAEQAENVRNQRLSR